MDPVAKTSSTDKPQQNPVAVLQQVSFSGPLPPPSILRQYDEVVPGAAERIIKMAEDQSKHRQELENAVIKSDISNSKSGLLFGFVIGMSGVIGSVVLVMTDHELTGSVLGATTLLGLVGTFVYGSRARRRDLEEKREDTKQN